MLQLQRHKKSEEDILSLVFVSEDELVGEEEGTVKVKNGHGRTGVKNIDGYENLYALMGTEHSLARVFKEVQTVPIKRVHLFRNTHGRYWISSNDEEANSTKIVENWADFAFDEMFSTMVQKVAKMEKKNAKIGK